MAKTQKTKTKKKQEPAYKLRVDGDVVDSVIIQGNKNKVTIQRIERLKTASALFTIHPPVTDFTGREPELEKLRSEFSRGALITGISGGGGVGKTELARRLAQELEGQFPDARMELNLQGTLGTPLATDEALRRLLEPFYPNQKLPDESAQLKGLYQETFSKHKALLLLDNAANASQVRLLIPPAPSGAIITSRNHFSLSEKGLKDPLRLDVLSYEEARGLLQGATQKLQNRTDEELDALSDLCGRLPLALRVAAALLNDRPDWSLDTLKSRLSDERTRLTKLKREEDQDLDIGATISLSYNQLGDLQNPFRYLGIFPAPFWSISAAALWGIEKVEDAEDLLGRLVSRNLVHFLPAEGSAAGLYVLHDLTRLYALERLREDGTEIVEAIEQHAEHFLSLAVAVEEEYLKGNEHVLTGLNLFRSIWPHLAGAYERYLPEQKDWPRPATADRWLSDFPDRCIYVMELLLPPKMQIVYLQSALEAAKRSGDRKYEGIHLGNLGIAYAGLGDARRAIELYEGALAISREIGDRRGEGNTLGNLGNAYADLGDIRKAIEFHEQALVIDREVGDRRGEGASLGNLGTAYAALGDARRAIEFYEKDLEIAREIGDRRGEGADFGNLGLAYIALGDVHKAIEFHEKALAIDREIGDRRGEGQDLTNLGVAYATLGDMPKAIEFCEQALAISREIGDRRGEGQDLSNLGGAYRNLGEARKAIELHEQALLIDREIGDRRGEGQDLGNLGIAYKNLGEARKAIEFHEQALLIDREIGNRQGESGQLGDLGNAYFDLGEARKAIEYYEQALVIDREIGHRRGVGSDLGNLGSAYADLGDTRKAIEFYGQALAIDREIGDRPGEGAELGNLGSAYADLGDYRKAIEYGDQALVIAQETGDRQNEGNLLCNLGNAHAKLGEKEKARELLQQALAILEAIESPNVGKVHGWLKKLDEK